MSCGVFFFFKLFLNIISLITLQNFILEMFLFTKSRKNTESDYRRLEDIETRDQFLSPTEKFSPNQDGLNYRAAFYGVSTFYILTLILGSLLWRFGSNITAVPSRIDSM